MGIHSDAFIESQREAVITSLDKMAIPGSPGSDVYMSAFAPAMGRILLRREFDEDIFNNVLDTHEEPERRAHKFMRAVQKPLMRYSPDHVMHLPQARHLEPKDIQPHAVAYAYDYPSEEFKSIEHWHKVIHEQWEHEDLRIDFRLDNKLWNLQTNRASRGKGLKLAMVAYDDRFDEPTVIDIGASQNQVAKQLVLNKKYPYSYTRAGSFVQPDHDFEVSAVDTAIVNEALILPPKNIDVIGYDMHRESHIDGLLWTRACWRPSDLANKQLMEQFDTLTAEMPANVHYGTADFSRPYEDCFHDQPPHANFSYAFISTMLHQFPYSEQPNVLGIAEKVTHDEGIVVVQDFFLGDIDPQQPHATHEIYHPDARYLLIVKDRAEPEKGYQIFAEWDGGSCNKIEMLAGRTALAQRLIN